LLVEAHGSAVEPVRRDVAEHDVGVRNCRRDAAPAIADGSRIGPGAFRADDDHALVVAGDTASACADLDHLDGRNIDGQSAAPLVPNEIDFERRHDCGRTVVDGAQLRGGPAHIVGDDLIAACFLAHYRAHENAGRGAGLDDAYRKVAREIGRYQSAVRL